MKKRPDAIFVHHGIFWDNEAKTITVVQSDRKIALLLNHNINLFGFHLPLDDHPDIGNNVELGKLLGIKNMQPVKDSLLLAG